jgi:hypothetical protein
MKMYDIPQDWIKGYVDQLLEIAKKLETGPLKDATLLRAEHAMDLVKAYRESK